MPFWWWIRIRIRGSMPLTNGSGSLPFSSLTFKTLTKNKFKKKFFYFLLFGTFTSFFKDNKKKRSHKTVEIKVFLSRMLNDRRIRIRTRIRIHNTADATLSSMSLGKYVLYFFPVAESNLSRSGRTLLIFADVLTCFWKYWEKGKSRAIFTQGIECCWV
jgi:hypothetical protein